MAHPPILPGPSNAVFKRSCPNPVSRTGAVWAVFGMWWNEPTLGLEITDDLNCATKRRALIFKPSKIWPQPSSAPENSTLSHYGFETVS